MANYDLVDINEAKDYLRLSGTTDDQLLTPMIGAATEIMETFCWRRFLSRAYTEWYDGSGGQYLWLPNHPITQLDRVCTDTISVLRVWNTSTDATYATVRPTATGLTLTVVGGANASASTQAYATYTTITLLAARIIAVGNGWTAEALGGFGYMASASLKPLLAGQGALVNGTANQYAELVLPGFPLSEVEIDVTGARIYAPSGFPLGASNVFAAYTGGYDTTSTTHQHRQALYDLKGICLDIVKSLYEGRSQDANMQSESLGDYSYTLAQRDSALSENLRHRLLPYRRVAL